MLFKNLVRTSKRTPHITITEINWLMLFKEIIAVYAESHTKRDYISSSFRLNKQRQITLFIFISGKASVLKNEPKLKDGPVSHSYGKYCTVFA
jgi:hypothetical protein